MLAAFSDTSSDGVKVSKYHTDLPERGQLATYQYVNVVSKYSIQEGDSLDEYPASPAVKPVPFDNIGSTWTLERSGRHDGKVKK